MWRYYAFKIAGFTLCYLPKKVGYLVAYLIADIIYISSPRLRAAVADNMKHVLGPQVDNATLKQAVRGVLRNTAKNYFDLIKIPRIKLDDIERSITIHGWHHFEQALKRGKGVILVTAHLGSFDMCAQVLVAHSVKGMVPVERLEPESLLRHVTSLRASKGLNFVPVGHGASKGIMQSLRHGEVVLLAGDRDIREDGLKSKFFGEETTMPAGAVRLAMRTEAAVVPVFNIRRGGRYDVYFEPAIEIVSAGNETLARNMEQVIAVMEKYIRICPEQWVILSHVWAGEH